MSATPAGWYPDPDDRTQLRWWDGETWTQSRYTPPAGDAPPAPPASPPNALRPWIPTIIGGAVTAFFALVFGLTSGLAGLLTVLGLAALLTGIYVTITGRRSWLRLPSRNIGAIVLAVGAIAFVVGPVYGAANTSMNSSLDSASIAEHSSPTPSATRTPTPTPTPVVTQKEIQEVAPIPFERVNLDDTNLDAGTTVVTVGGVDGEQTTTYTVTYTDGVETARTVARQEVTRQPVAEVTNVGTRQPPPPVEAPAAPAEPAPEPAPAGDCDPNYSGGCVPVASDVDCAGGSGNGPAYVDGPVYVVGSDVYDLDRDGDGTACD